MRLPPLTRWVEIRERGEGVEVVWNLDDTRPGAAGRLALYAGTAPGPDQLPDGFDEHAVDLRGVALTVRHAALEDADDSLRPVRELVWEADGLHLRLTTQGPWPLQELLELAASVQPAPAAS